MPTFEEKIERLKRIFRGQEPYGEGTPAEQANQFRFKEMMEEIVNRARSRTFEACPQRKVDFLISLSGFSPITTILAYEILCPRRVLVVTSERAERGIDVIADHILKPGKLHHYEFAHRPCDPTDPKGIYNIVRDGLKSFPREGNAPPIAMLDITGGKKVMSATAALAAWQLDLLLCYVDGDYDNELRQPAPGSERLLILDNPMTLFGEQELATADEVFRAGAYEAALEQYKSLSERISDPGRARLLRDLSSLYSAWCSLELGRLPELVSGVEVGLVVSGVRLTPKTADRLREQLAFLQLLTEKDSISLLLSYYLLGLHYDEVHRHDFAALLFYRTIEGCLTQRLERKFSGFTCREPDYRSFPVDSVELLKLYNEAADAIGPNHRETGLPRRIGLINAAALLYAINDDLAQEGGFRTPKAIAKLHGLTDARNQSVLAHGFRSITADQSRDLQGIALCLLRAFWKLHKPDENVDERCTNLRFLRGINE